MAYPTSKQLYLNPYGSIVTTAVQTYHENSYDASSSPYSALIEGGDASGHAQDDCYAAFASTAIGTAKITIRMDNLLATDYLTPDGGRYRIKEISPRYKVLGNGHCTSATLRHEIKNSSGKILISDTYVDQSMYVIGGSGVSTQKRNLGPYTHRSYHEKIFTHAIGTDKIWEETDIQNIYWSVTMTSGAFGTRTHLGISYMQIRVDLEEVPKPTISSGEIVLNSGEMVIK